MTSIDACDSLTIVLASSLGIYRTIDGGKAWKVIYTNQFGSITGDLIDISIIDSCHVWVACSQGAILATTDGGTHWTIQFFDSTKSDFINYVKFFDPNNGIAIGDGSTNTVAVLRTSDGGTHWSSTNIQPLNGWSGDTWRRMDFINKDVGYFYVSGLQILNKTTDGGSTWIPVATQLPYVEILKFFNKNIGFAIAGTDSIFRTLDGAATWQEFSTFHKGWGNDIEFAPSNPAHIWMTDNLKVYFSGDTGKTWTIQSDVGGRDIVFPSDCSGWFVGDGGKLYHTANGGITSIDMVSSQPTEFMVYQNYPNPFNPSTVISFTLHMQSKVRLTIYNLLGQTVTTLIDCDFAAGLHSVTWNSNASTGIYFYHIEMVAINNPGITFSSTKKMLLLR
jgi:photosystem II stability/assembly factor-like uncharacterized protein